MDRRSFSGEWKLSRFTGIAKVLASTHLGMVADCKTAIALSIQREFHMAAKLSFPMRHV